jgi:MFS family permease
MLIGIHKKLILFSFYMMKPNHSTSYNNFSKLKSSLTSTVLIAGLGYFVDIYDLLLFGIVRVASLKDLGLSEAEFLSAGIFLVNLQMAGMLVGGILWGILGDKKGRVSVLFGSILLYSIANILNAFANSVPIYGILRFFAGVGLAGELGAAITLVSETLKKEDRGYGTTLVATIGIMGAVFAGIVGDLFHWRTSYLIGGVMGLVLLFMRLSIYESGLFHATQHQIIRKGDIRMLFYPRVRFFKYIRCILIGIPIWFAIGIPITFSPELAKALHVAVPISAGKSILFCYLGGSIGNLCCGLISQHLRSRRKAAFLFLILLLACILILLFAPVHTAGLFYSLCALLGFTTGYWVIFMALTTEQFGTNLRATVTTTVPNFVRFSVVPLTLSFHLLQNSFGIITSTLILGIITVSLAALCLLYIQETFENELDFIEPHAQET